MKSETKVLIIADNLESLNSQVRLLKDAGYLVWKAENGNDGIRLMRKHKPDLVLLDLEMSDKKGDEICGLIKTDPLLNDVFVIQLCGVLVSSERRAYGFPMGADEYLSRPISKQELINRLNLISRFQQTKKELQKIKIVYAELMERNAAEIIEQMEHQKILIDSAIERESQMGELKKIIRKLRKQLIDGGIDSITNGPFNIN